MKTATVIPEILYEESTEYDAIEIDDGPLIQTWKPRNFGEKFYGPTTIREALTKSRNVVTVKVLRDVGVKHAIRYARKLGITTPLARDLSLALGSSSVSLLEMTGAFAVFANNGNKPEPLFIKRIVDKDGNILEENRPCKRAGSKPPDRLYHDEPAPRGGGARHRVEGQEPQETGGGQDRDDQQLERRLVHRLYP